MALNKAQLMAVPGGPGVVGSVKAGQNVVIDPDGTINCPQGGGVFGGVYKIQVGPGLAIDPPSGTGAVTLYYAVPVPTPFETGTTVVIANAAAPTGWTKLTTADNAAFRVVAGVGGGVGGSLNFTDVYKSQAVGGTTVAAVASDVSGTTDEGSWTPRGNINFAGVTLQGTSLSVGQTPSHFHTWTQMAGGGVRAGSGGNWGVGSRESDGQGGGAHAHGGGGTVAVGGAAIPHVHDYIMSVGVQAGVYAGTAFNMSIQYIDSIIVRKN